MCNLWTMLPYIVKTGKTSRSMSNLQMYDTDAALLVVAQREMLGKYIQTFRPRTSCRSAALLE